MRHDTPGALRVLVADGDRDSADSTCLLLGLYGHRAEAAYGGADALAKAEALRPHVVVLDLPLPGPPALPRLRELGARLVVVTGWADEGHRRQAAEAGAAHYLVKPAEPDRLNAVLASLRPPGA